MIDTPKESGDTYIDALSPVYAGAGSAAREGPVTLGLPLATCNTRSTDTSAFLVRWVVPAPCFLLGNGRRRGKRRS